MLLFTPIFYQAWSLINSFYLLINSKTLFCFCFPARFLRALKTWLCCSKRSVRSGRRARRRGSTSGRPSEGRPTRRKRRTSSEERNSERKSGSDPKAEEGKEKTFENVLVRTWVYGWWVALSISLTPYSYISGQAHVSCSI